MLVFCGTMKTPSPLPDEKRRIEVLWQYEVLDTPPEEAFDELTTLAADICEAPIALISLVDENRQWFKSRVGLTVTETARDISFCGHAIHQPGLFIVPDATLDERFADNPLVTSEPHIRFYAGAPLATCEGLALGTLCVIDRVPREMSARHQEALHVLSHYVMTQLDLRRRSRELARAHFEREQAQESLRREQADVEILRRSMEEQKRAAETLRESQEMLRLITENSTDLIAIVDIEGKRLFNSRAYSDVLGPPEALRGTDSFAEIHPEDRERVRRLFKESLRLNTGLRTEFRFVLKDGSVRHIESQGNIIRDDAGKPEKVMVISRDVTKRKTTERILRESEQRFHAIFENATDGILMADLETLKFHLTNDTMCRMLGYTREEISTLGLADIHPPESLSWIRAAFEQQVRGELATARDVPVRRRNGTLFYADVSSAPITLDGKKYMAGFFRDITERKRVEDALRESQSNLESAQSITRMGSWDLDLAAGKGRWSKEMLRLFDRDPALGAPQFTDFLEMVHPEDRTRLMEIHQRVVESGEQGRLEFRTNPAHGPIHHFATIIHAVKESSGPVRRMTGTVQDITERKQLEANFFRAQRLESIGALASGVAHDLNNILQPILMSMRILREKTDDPESREMLHTVENCAQRGADIIKQLLLFARGKPSACEPLPVQHLFGEMNKLIRETFPKNIQLRVNVPQNLWQALGDATQINQALMNLCVNARDAMPDGGTLTLAAENLTLDEAFAAVMLHAKPGHYICLSVTDTGMGIPPEHLDRIFDPFFTTKEIGKGTGLGLATVLGIVQGHSGFVRVNSQIDKGTTFELYLPASLEAKAGTLPERDTLPPRTGGEMILVVDDEASVRGVVGRTLERHGYRVVLAAEGGEAMVLFARHRAEIRAVLTDMMMPEMDGPSLVRALRNLDPQLPILGMTGVGERTVIKELETLDLLALLTKPFSSVALLGVLHQALAASRQAKA